MSSPTKQIADFEAALIANAPSYGIQLSDETLEKLAAYYQLFLNWNPRLHLVAPCSAEEFAQRHILESLLLQRDLPDAARIVDIGSGAGLPIIPCLIARADLYAVLIESAKRKAVFLREVLQLVDRAKAATVIAERFEALVPPDTKFITSRALDRFAEMLPRLIAWAPRPCTLLLFGGDELKTALDSLRLTYSENGIPNSERRLLFVVKLAEPR